MKQARDRALELLNMGDLADCIKENHPNWIQSAIWEKLIHDHWPTNEFKELFDKNKKNMLKKKDSDLTRHVGGSVNTKIYKKTSGIISKFISLVII